MLRRPQESRISIIGPLLAAAVLAAALSSAACFAGAESAGTPSATSLKDPAGKDSAGKDPAGKGPAEKDPAEKGESDNDVVAGGEGATRLTSGQLRRDLDFLYESLQQAHFNLFVHTPKAEYDRHYEELRASLDRPLELAEAQRRFQRFMAAGRIGHSRIDSPSSAFAEFRQAGGRAAPFYFRVVRGRAFVTESYGNPRLRRGDEILGLEGEPIGAWLERLASPISAESDALAYSLLEFRFPQLFWDEIGEVESLRLEARTPGASPRELTVRTLDQEELRAAASDASPQLELDWSERSARLIDGVAYLRPGPFYEPESGGYDPTAFREFLDDAFDRFLDAGADRLLIDLRNNPGGDNSFSDPMVAWFADRRFRFCSSFRIKVSEQTRASNRRRLEANPHLDGASRALAEIYESTADGEIVDYELPFAEPRDGRRFAGEVYLLVNRHSYSNAVTVAALVQDYGFGVVLGETTADVATSYGAMEHFTLPETGLLVGYPKAHLVRPNGDERLRGVTPDVPIETPILEGPEDPVLQAALAHVRTANGHEP